jgi:ubiquinone/menaquinone biosynthesis C-methylase UbiE
LKKEIPGNMLVEDSIVATVFAWIAIVLGALLLYVAVVTRIVRHLWDFPIPPFAARFIDNPLRRWLQPPRTVVDWLDLGEGMSVLEIGPGPGTFTFEASRRIGEQGKLHAVDIAPDLISRLERRLQAEGVANVAAKVASAYELPFPDSTFDRVFMITVLAEIPDKVRALREVRRVLKYDGQLAVGEFLIDPDYPWRKTVIRWCNDAGLTLVADRGGLMHYVLRFRKAAQA